MSRPKKDRIDVNAGQSGLKSQAFAGLELGGLPAGPEAPAAPSPSAPAPSRKMGRVVLRREKAHRGGKTVIVAHDFATHITGAQIEELARKVRAACGCGGTVKDRTIEIQGDQPDKVRACLEAEGFQVVGVK